MKEIGVRTLARPGRNGWQGALRLLRHEQLILRTGFSAAFSSWRDRLLLAIIVAIAILWLRDTAPREAPAADRRILAGASLLFGWLVVRAVRRRMAHLADESPLAADALDPVGRRACGSIIASGALTPMLAFAMLVVPDGWQWVALGLGGGAAAAAALPLGATTRLAWASRDGCGPGALPGRDGRAIVAPIALAGVTALIAWLARESHGDAAASLAAVLAELSALAWLIRPDEPVARFLAIAGWGPWRAAILQLAPAARLAFVAPLMIWPLAGSQPALVAALAGFTAVSLALLRAWLFRLHRRPIADTILSLGVTATVAAAVAAPPLGLLLGMAMAAALYRRSAEAKWRLD